MEPLLVVVLAGGRGERMNILCRNRPKPELPMAGLFRTIDFTLSNIAHSSIRDAYVLVDYQRAALSRYLKRWTTANDAVIELNPLYPRKTSYAGTADAVFQNFDRFGEYPADTVLVLAADHVYKMDYRDMIRFHREVNADATVGVIPVPIEQAHLFGIVTVNDENRVTGFVEKPRLPQSNLVSMGIYVFNKQKLAESLVKDAHDEGSPHDFGHAILPDMVERDNVFAYRFDGYWRDIGNIQTYYATNMDLLGTEPSLVLDGTWPVLSDGGDILEREEPGEAVISDSLFGRSCVIEGRVSRSVISPEVRIGSGSLVKDSVIMRGARIGERTVIDTCVIDESVEIGDGCWLGDGPSFIPEGWDITVVGNGAVVPDRTIIGRNCTIMPWVSPEDFRTPIVPYGGVVAKRS